MMHCWRIPSIGMDTQTRRFTVKRTWFNGRRVVGIKGWAIGLLIGLAIAVSAGSTSAAPQAHRFELAPTGNEARYRVREQFIGVNLPNDAVGATSAITGRLAFDATGKVIPAESRMVVNITGLKSDSENRDRQVQERLLQGAKFPEVVLAVTEARGLTFPLPASGELEFQLLGNLTVQGVTKPSTWEVTATPKAGGLAGQATTTFKFGDFGMPVPTSFRLLSVEDNLRLEYDFHFVPSK
jgi:polyisoprenoid-binding protein YceI